MPIYECHCVACDYTFEVLAAVGQANRRHPCPGCGKAAPRIASTFAIVSGGPVSKEAKTGGELGGAKNPAAKRRPAQRPLCLQNPHIPLLCHMDEPSARRWVARFNGRGAEYDDRMGERAEMRKKRGLPPPPPPEPAAHGHTHGHNPRRHTPSSPDSHAKTHAHGHDHKDGSAHAHHGGAGHSH
jgi:putative FmdB family regulatory protein